MDSPEIIFNPWFVYDDLDMIYSSHARASADQTHCVCFMAAKGECQVTSGKCTENETRKLKLETRARTAARGWWRVAKEKTGVRPVLSEANARRETIVRSHMGSDTSRTSNRRLQTCA